MTTFDILTLFPEIFPPVLETSILGRAAKNKLLSFRYTNIRSFSKNKHNKVDDYPYGGGLGMVMTPQPIVDAHRYVTDALRSEYPDDEDILTVYLSPRGRRLNQEVVKEMAQYKHIVLLCGHYEGVDQRAIDQVSDFELSVGDFVLTGGEIGAMVVCDAVARLIPGVLAESESFEGESHYRGLLEHPQYTRPATFEGRSVPSILLSGKQEEIDKWRLEKALKLTEAARPDMFSKATFLPYASTTEDVSDTPFVIASVSFSPKNRDFIYKHRRKLYRKFLKNSLFPKEAMTVFSSFDDFMQFYKTACLPVVVLADSSQPFDNALDLIDAPLCVLTEKNDNRMLYPYYINALDDKTDIAEEVFRFLSLVRILSKYQKNMDKNEKNT